MKYYKYLDIDFLKVFVFFQNYFEENKRQFKNIWNDIDTEKLLLDCPDIQGMFNPLNITIKKISIIVTDNTSIDFGIHKDYVPEKVRINLPVLNCESSITNFYKSSKPPMKKFLSNGVPLYYFERTDCELVDSFCLNKPAAINVQELHQVLVTTPNTVRVSCTISFNENIDYLLKE